MEIASAISEPAFLARRQPDWNALDALVRAAQSRGVRRLSPEQVARLSPLYRDVCADLSRAVAAHYSAALTDYLQGLTAAGHTIVYGSAADARLGGATRSRRSPLGLALLVFPRAVRRHRVAMVVAFILFFAPFFGALFATLADPSFAVRIVPESMLRPLTDSYQQGFAAGRGAGTDAAMAGFYVSNNVGIALRCFATGLLFGIGSVVYLVENGLSTGAVMGYVTAHGAGGNILTFVVGHGSLELGAIVLAGGAGLALGWSMVSPGELTRAASLRAAAKSVISIVFGAAVMLFMAAAVEAFWSASSVPTSIKRAGGAVMFVAVLAYILFAGRRSTEAELFERAQADRWI